VRFFGPTKGWEKGGCRLRKQGGVYGHHLTTQTCHRIKKNTKARVSADVGSLQNKLDQKNLIDGGKTLSQGQRDEKRFHHLAQPLHADFHGGGREGNRGRKKLKLQDHHGKKEGGLTTLFGNCT